MAVMHYDEGHARRHLACGTRTYSPATKDKHLVTCKRCLRSMGVAVPAKEPEKVTPALVQEKLAAMFAEVEPAFRANTRTRYKRQAEAEHSAWIKRLNTSEDGKYKSRLGFTETYRPGQYVRYERRDKYDGGPFSWKGEQAAKNRYLPDYMQAQRDADRAVDDARATFLHRQGRKITVAVEGRDDLAEVVGKLRLEGVVTGGITVRMGNGDQFTLYTQIITNYRYEPRFVSFYQFPARFHNITKDEQTHNSKSASWMEMNF